MEYIAGFYIVIGLMIIIFGSRLMKGFLNNLFRGNNKEVKNINYFQLKNNHLKHQGKLILQQVPVRSIYNTSN